MNITKNFTLEELIESDTADREGFIEQYSPPVEVIENLKILCINLLQPLRNLLPGVMIVSSGYRCKRLNSAVGSKDTSQHPKGQAADIQYFENGEMKNKKLRDVLYTSGLEFDQCIDEHKGAWTHLSYNLNHNRKMNLTIN